MDYQPKIELGQILQMLGSVVAAAIACVFAYVFLVSDVDQAKGKIKENKEAIVQEQAARIREDDRLRLQIEAESLALKKEVQASETRQKFLLENIRDDVKFLVRERRNESGTPKK